MSRISQIAAIDSTVLITGESGTGKEMIARQIYQQAIACRHNFVPINCGALPETLAESELFGYKKGAFTGAVTDNRGLIDAADGGMLFLDEVGEMPLSTQVCLLRFLDSGEFRRLGDGTIRHAKVRVIAATNRPLEEDVSTGRFRLDLFYRLSVVSLHVPPLRERVEDIAPLAEYYLRRTASRLGGDVKAFSEDTIRSLQEHRWPGNVRELQNVVETAVIFATGDTIKATDLSLALNSGFSCEPESTALLHLQNTLSRVNGNRKQAAAALGIHRTTLWRQLRRLKDTDSASRGGVNIKRVQRRSDDDA